MEKSVNKELDRRDETQRHGLTRNSLSGYHLASAQGKADRTAIPLPTSTSLHFKPGNTASRRSLQPQDVSSSSPTKIPGRRPSIPRYRVHNDPTYEKPRAARGYKRGVFSQGTVNNPRKETARTPIAPQRQLMQPLGPPFPKSQTLGRLDKYANTSTGSEENEPPNFAGEKSCGYDSEDNLEAYEDHDTGDTEILKTPKQSKPEVENAYKWKLTPLERLGQKVGAETTPELPAQRPEEGGWLWDEDDARMVSG